MLRLAVTFSCTAIIAFFSLADTQANNDDWYISASNYARYYHFNDSKEDSAATRFQFDIYMGKFYTGAWYELEHVMDYTFGNSTSNSLTQRYFGWADDGLTIHVGNFYQVFDRGMILNTFRDDEVNIDLVLDGIQLNLRRKYVNLDVIAATPGIGDLPFGSKPIIRGMRIKLKPVSIFHLGGAYVSYTENTRTNLSQINLRINKDYFDGYVEYAKRNYKVMDPNNITQFLNKTGDGTYANITAFYSMFTGMFEYKNYQNLIYPDVNYLNVPPAVNKQDRLLQSEAANSFIYIKGERGYRGNLSVSWSDYWGVEFDYAKAFSRDTIDVYLYEYYLGLRGNYLQDNTFYTSIDFFEFSKRDETKFEIETEYRLDDFNSVSLNGKIISFEPVDSAEYTEKYIDLTLARAPNYRLTIGASISNNDFSDSPKRKMGYAELMIILGNHDLIIFHGGQRGGLVCSGGLCYYHPTFEGLRVTLRSRF